MRLWQKANTKREANIYQPHYFCLLPVKHASSWHVRVPCHHVMAEENIHVKAQPLRHVKEGGVKEQGREGGQEGQALLSSANSWHGRHLGWEGAGDISGLEEGGCLAARHMPSMLSALAGRSRGRGCLSARCNRS